MYWYSVQEKNTTQRTISQDFRSNLYEKKEVVKDFMKTQEDVASVNLLTIF